jgi:hypothetical protein
VLVPSIDDGRSVRCEMENQLPVELKVIRCDVCRRGLTLSYQRASVAESVETGVVGTQWAQCPWSECLHTFAVILPMDAAIVATTPWFGLSNAPQTSSRPREYSHPSPESTKSS